MSVGAGVVIGPGVRIRESIILENAVINDHTLVLHAISKKTFTCFALSMFIKLLCIKIIVGRGSTIGQWSRVEGTPTDPDPNKPFVKMDNPPLFNKEGKLNPSITILGKFLLSDYVIQNLIRFENI